MIFSSDLISTLGVQLISSSTEMDRGMGVPGKIGLVTWSQNRDQGGQEMQVLSSVPQDLPRESPARGHALKECQGCTQGQGPSQSLTPEEALLQDQHLHLPQGKEQDIPGAVFCIFVKVIISKLHSPDPGQQTRLLSRVGKGRRLPGGIRSSSSPGGWLVNRHGCHCQYIFTFFSF